jgi:hypothetical protein
MNKDALRTALAHFISEVERQANSTHEANDRPLYDKFLSKSAIIMTKVEQNEPIGDYVSIMERLFGNTWFNDENAYTQIYSEWDLFKSLLEQEQSIHAMTVNERLYSLGLFEEFDTAVAVGDMPRLRALLSKCFLDNDDIETIIKQEIKDKK